MGAPPLLHLASKTMLRRASQIGLLRCYRPSMELVLHELARAHDDPQIAPLGGKQLDVLERVAIDDDQVRERPLFDATELTFVLQEGRVGRGDLAQDLQRREDLPANRELPALLHVCFPEQVRTKADPDARPAHRLHPGECLLVGELRLLLALWRKSEPATVLDGPHTELHAAAHGARRMTVRGRVGAALDRLIDDGADLILPILIHPDGIGRRGNPTRAHDLDAVGPPTKLLARRLEDLVHSVSDDAE